MIESKPVTIRLPLEVYEGAKKAAGRGSFNNFVIESVRACVKQFEDEALFNSFTMLGEIHEESDVEFAFGAQGEVALSGE